MSDTIEVYETYFECIGLGKGKNKEWKCRGCHQRWTCPVTKLRATSFKVQGKDTRLCTKTYSSQEVETMQLLETKIAEVSMHRRSSAWRTRVTLCLTLEPLHRLHLPHSGLALHNSHAPLPPHLHARTPLCLRKGSSPFLALCFRKGSSPFLAWPLRNDTIKQTCSSVCFSMAAASPSTCHAVLCLSVHCVAEAGPGFKPVSYNALRGSMLDKVGYGHSFTAEPCFWRSQATGEVRKERLRSL